jgi:CO dehydrogenase maturation factor
MLKIVVAGKGGVGKSSVVYVMARVLSKRGKRVFVVDTDESNQTLYRLFGFESPALSFMDYFGGKQKVKESLMRRLKSGEKEVKTSLLERERFTLEDLPEEIIQKDGKIVLMSIGKIKEPHEGCACPMGVLSREFLEKVVLKEGEYILVDTEAGIEHFGRGLERGIDVVIALAEPYLDSIEVAEKILNLAQKMNKPVYLILNKVQKDTESKVKEFLKNRGLPLAGLIHFSPEVYALSLEGKVPEGGEVFHKIEEILEKILKES